MSCVTKKTKTKHTLNLTLPLKQITQYTEELTTLFALCLPQTTVGHSHETGQ
ncbi:hypothetical protein EXN66_Car011221 [Channa argus]|uniref:Uncharacterized protein n=1 Tax=Channa argus TaxID=215402 RepID=A0A6G1PZ52_CHAAH|nr:hypothetical protein EXN66_Car011221 [Channa argus]